MLIHRIPICSPTPPYLPLPSGSFHLLRLTDNGVERVYKKGARVGVEGAVLLLRKHLRGIGDRVWLDIRVHRLQPYRCCHLPLRLFLCFHSIIIILHRMLRNMVKDTDKYIRDPVLVHGNDPLCQVTIQDPSSLHPRYTNQHPYHSIMNKSRPFHHRFNTPQKMRRHGIKPLSMSILRSHRGIPNINKLPPNLLLRNIIMSIQPLIIQLMKDIRI